MKMIISQRDGAKQIAKQAAKVKRWTWEFVISGEGSQSMFHEWKCAFYLGRNSGRTVYALQLVDLTDSEGEEDPEPYEEIVAIMLDPVFKDENGIVRYLLDEYKKAGGKYIELIDMKGVFELDEGVEAPPAIEDPRQQHLNLKKEKPLKPSAAIKPYLKSDLPKSARIRSWAQLTDADLDEFKKFLTKRPDNAYKRGKRREIKKHFGKLVKELTLDEYQDFQKPNFNAPDYLKNLWRQLSPEEQDLVKQLNQWAFNFPASFENEDDFLEACAGRLKRFFGRNFHVKRQ